MRDRLRRFVFETIWPLAPALVLTAFVITPFAFAIWLWHWGQVVLEFLR